MRVPTPADEQRHSLLEIDQYIERLFVPRDFVFLQALRDAAEAGLPKINVSANEGKLLYLLARIAGARRVLEIGLLGGYSTMWLAQAIGPQGRLVSLEVDEKCIGVARKNLERAGLGSRIEIRHGDAQVLLKRMVDGEEQPFDVVFIDADKPSYPLYLDYAVKLTHPGSLILADNVIRDGKVAQVGEADKLVQGIQEFNRKIAVHPKLETIEVIVMREGIDGLAIARVKD
jgi:predicted O-methyltransferase YrrM